MRVADVLGDVEVIAGIGTSKRDTLRRGLQELLFRYASAWPWPHYRDRGTITMVDDVSTGTASITNGSTAVTFTGATLVDGMAGRKIRFSSEEQWYDILSVNTGAGTVVLVQAYQGSTNTVATFLIYQDEFRLDPNCERALDFVQLEDQVQMIVFTYLEFDRLFSDVGSLGDPIYITMIGRRDDRFITGTLALTANSRAIVGSSTGWDAVDGLGDGSRIAVEDTGEVFTVRSVDSATGITAYELAAANEGSSTYIIFLNNIKVQVRDIPDAARHLYYRFQRRPFLPVRDYDELDAPLEHHGMIKEGLLSLAWQTKGNAGMAEFYDKKFGRWLAEQVREIGHDHPMPMVVKESMDGLIGEFPRLRLPNTYGHAQFLE